MESQSTNQDDHSAQDEAPNPKRQRILQKYPNQPRDEIFPTDPKSKRKFYQYGLTTFHGWSGTQNLTQHLVILVGAYTQLIHYVAIKVMKHLLLRDLKIGKKLLRNFRIMKLLIHIVHTW